MQINKFLFFLIILLIYQINHNQKLNAMEIDIEEVDQKQINDEESSIFIEDKDDYFTYKNTQVGIITQKSISEIIANNTYLPNFNIKNINSLKSLIKSLNLALFKNMPSHEASSILEGMNALIKSDCTEQFSIFRIDLNSVNSHKNILESLGKITGKYLTYSDRSYGFNITALLKNETELWLCEIPPKESLEQVLDKAKKGSFGESPFSGKEGEVSQALDMFSPLLKILFIDGQPEEIQVKRKAYWSCFKGSAIILAMLVVGAYMFLDIFYKCNTQTDNQ